MAQEAPPALPGLRLTHHEAPANPAAHGAPADVDALAELFLGPNAKGGPAAAPGRAASPAAPQRDRQPAPPHARQAHIEGLILGHLPVMGSAWAMQYAREVATQHGAPVGVLRLRGEEVSIEIVGGAAGALAAPASTLEEGLCRGVRAARTWLVRIDGPDESALAESALLDSITLLSGADQAAIVGAYSAIKRLFPSANERRDITARLRIVLVGSAEARTADARAALTKAATAFLAREVEIIPGPQRIGGGAAPAALLYRGEATAFDLIVDQLRQTLATEDPSPEMQATLAQPSLEPSSATRSELDRHLVRVMEQAVAEAGPRPASPVRTAPPAATRAEAGTLAAHLGLEALAPRSPYFPAVELAADRDGNLHLLTRAEAGADPVCSLLSVAAWAAAHSALLQLAIPALKTAAPVLHLFVGDARAARDLQETGVRLHLLAPVQVGTAAGWFCAALN